MATRKFIVDDDGTIKLVNVLKSGAVSPNGQLEVTDDTIEAALKHILLMEDFSRIGVAGYRVPSKEGEAAVWFCAFREDVYNLKPKEEFLRSVNKIDVKEAPVLKKRRRRKGTGDNE